MTSDEEDIRNEMVAELESRGLSTEDLERASTFLDWCLRQEHYIVPAEDDDG